MSNDIAMGKTLHNYLQSDQGKTFPLANPYKRDRLLHAANELTQAEGYIEPELFGFMIKGYGL